MFPAVSFPSVVGGFSYNEVKEMMHIMGSTPAICGLEISEFNPAVEMVQSLSALTDWVYSSYSGFSTLA